MATISKVKNRYRVQVRRQGTSFSKTFARRSDAETWGKKIELEVERGAADLPVNPKTKLNGATLGRLIEKYRDQISVRKKSCKKEQVALNAFLRADICSKPLAEISTKDFVRYRDQRLLTVAPVSLRRELAIIHHAFEIAKDEFGWPMAVNPLDKLLLHAPPVRRDRVLQGDELERIIEECKHGRKNKLLLPVVVWLVETAMRRGEALALRWSDIDLRNRLAIIRASKNGKPRKVPISDKAYAVLEGLDPAKGERVFPINENTLANAWKNVTKRLGLADATMHDLRHTGLTSLLAKGANVAELRAVSGHSNLTMLGIYLNPDLDGIRRKMNLGNYIPASEVRQ